MPHDCTDGFLSAYWRRPAAYLDARVRAAMSSFRALGDVSEALARLDCDLRSGVWAERHGRLLGLDACDCGYRARRRELTRRTRAIEFPRSLHSVAGLRDQGRRP